MAADFQQHIDTPAQRVDRTVDADALWYTWRQIATFISAIGLANITKNIVAWKGLILTVVTAWHDIMHPVAEFLFGWLFQWLHIAFPSLLKDWMLVGLIMIGGLLRAIISPEGRRILFQIVEIAERPARWVTLLIVLLYLSAPLTWPLFVYSVFRSTGGSRLANLVRDQRRIIRRYWLSTFAWFFLLLIVNYVAYEEFSRDFLLRLWYQLIG